MLPGSLMISVAGAMTLVDLGSADASTGWRTLPRIPRGPRVKNSDTYKQTIGYVKSAGVWKLAIPYLKKDGTWKAGGG